MSENRVTAQKGKRKDLDVRMKFKYGLNIICVGKISIV